jgi:hypothetical protein
MSTFPRNTVARDCRGVGSRAYPTTTLTATATVMLRWRPASPRSHNARSTERWRFATPEKRKVGGSTLPLNHYSAAQTALLLQKREDGVNCAMRLSASVDDRLRLAVLNTCLSSVVASRRRQTWVSLGNRAAWPRPAVSRSARRGGPRQSRGSCFVAGTGRKSPWPSCTGQLCTRLGQGGRLRAA